MQAAVELIVRRFEPGDWRGAGAMYTFEGSLLTSTFVSPPNAGAWKKVFQEARIAARYLAKYMSKSVDDQHLSGLHRYEVAQGFQPQPIECRGESADDVIARASTYMEREPHKIWRSWEQEGWGRSPAYWCEWAS